MGTEVVEVQETIALHNKQKDVFLILIIRNLNSLSDVGFIVKY